MAVQFWIGGEPAPQGSKKYVGRGIMIESSKKLPAWRKNIENTVRNTYKGEPIDRPVTVKAVFFMPKPKKPRFNEPATPPDLDKLQRALGDGLQKGGLLKDDSRIVCWESAKRYAVDRPTGCFVQVQG